MKTCEYQQIDPQALTTPTPTPPPHHGKDEREEPKRPRRKWEVFPGKNRFYCDGRIIVARQSGVLPLTLGLILVTSGLFFIFEWVHVSRLIPISCDFSRCFVTSRTKPSPQYNDYLRQISSEQCFYIDILLRRLLFGILEVYRTLKLVLVINTNSLFL